MLLIIQLACFAFCSAYFADDFSSFIKDNYGEQFRNLLQRSDLGDTGSFGGKGTPDEEIQNDPVIFVHGVSDSAGGKMKQMAAKLIRDNGYVEGELYGTTYYDGPKGNPVQWVHYSMRCEYVKQVRALILAARFYTGRNIDVVAYSLGVPIARKAILGGQCVDTDEELGSPLTRHIDTFVGIAGPNQGVAPRAGIRILNLVHRLLQIIGIPIPACVLGLTPICDPTTGLYSGICTIESSFLKDINKKEHYEGRYVYSIYSQNDQFVGYKVCEKITAKIPGEDGHKVFPNMNHEEVLTIAADMLPSLLRNHSTYEATSITEPTVVSSVLAKRKTEQNSESASTTTTTGKTVPQTSSFSPDRLQKRKNLLGTSSQSHPSKRSDDELIVEKPAANLVAPAVSTAETTKTAEQKLHGTDMKTGKQFFGNRKEAHRSNEREENPSRSQEDITVNANFREKVEDKWTVPEESVAEFENKWNTADVEVETSDVANEKKVSDEKRSKERSNKEIDDSRINGESRFVPIRIKGDQISLGSSEPCCAGCKTCTNSLEPKVQEDDGKQKFYHTLLRFTVDE